MEKGHLLYGGWESSIHCNPNEENIFITLNTFRKKKEHKDSQWQYIKQEIRNAA